MKYLQPSFSVAMPHTVSDEDWAAAFRKLPEKEEPITPYNVIEEYGVSLPKDIQRPE